METMTAPGLTAIEKDLVKVAFELGSTINQNIAEEENKGRFVRLVKWLPCFGKKV